MGEYYVPCILSSHKKTAPNKEKVIGWIYAHEFNNGLKQMEFGYIGNSVMNTLEALINKENGKYAGYPIVIAGDYDDLPENAFFMIGKIEEARVKAAGLARA